VSEKGENTLHEAAIGWGIILAIAAVLIWLIWYFYHVEIRDALRWFRYGQMYLLSFFINESYMVTINGSKVNFMEWFEYIPKYPAEKLQREHMSVFTHMVMQPIRIPCVIILSLLALWSFFKGPETQYRMSLGLDSLIKRQAKNFATISPFVSFNPSNQPVRPPGSLVPVELPAFAEALGPEEWLAYFKNPMQNGQVDQQAAAKDFSRQLCGQWKGAGRLKPYQQILLAAFCLKAARKRDQSDEMLGRIALCWDFKKGLQLNRDKKLIKEARSILRNKKISGSTLAKCNQHAFVTTALLRGLMTARDEGGVLAPAQFTWLRAHDRTLWYPLNNLGRQSFHIEALGAMAHFRSERRTSRPIPVPKMEHAVETIVEYMESNRARPIPKLDYKHSKTRGVKKAT